MERKKIIITTRGPIYPKGSLYGPMLTPFFEDIQTINSLIIKGYNVYEVLNNGDKIKLDLTNLGTDNNAKQKEDQAAIKAAEAKEKREAEEAARQAEHVRKQKEAEEKQQKHNKKHANNNQRVEDDTETK